MNEQAFARTIRAGGDVTINRQDYYVSRRLVGQRVTCWVNAAEKQFEIWQPGRRIKSIPIKGLHGQTLPFEEYVALMKREARSAPSGAEPHCSISSSSSSILDIPEPFRPRSR